MKVASLAAYATYVAVAVPVAMILGAEDISEALAMPLLAAGIAGIPLCVNLAPHRIGILGATLSVAIVLLAGGISYSNGDPETVENIVVAIAIALPFFVLTGNRTLRRVAMPLCGVLYAGSVAFVIGVLGADALCSARVGNSARSRLAKLITGPEVPPHPRHAVANGSNGVDEFESLSSARRSCRARGRAAQSEGVGARSSDLVISQAPPKASSQRGSIWTDRVADLDPRLARHYFTGKCPKT